MAATILTDATIWVHDQDVTGNSNQITLQMSAEDQDVTVFGNNGYRSRAAGLRNVEANAAGFYEALPDASTFTNLAVGDHVVTIAPASTEGSRSFTFLAGRFSYELFGAVGDAAPYSLDLQGTNTIGIARGLVTKAKGNVSAVAVLGTPQQVGAGGTGKFLYSAVHVFGTPGTTMTVQVQSSTTSGGVYTTRATHTVITTAGGFWLPAPGRVDATSFTDTWWRHNISAITGTFTVAAMIAIQ